MRRVRERREALINEGVRDSDVRAIIDEINRKAPRNDVIVVADEIPQSVQLFIIEIVRDNEKLHKSLNDLRDKHKSEMAIFNEDKEGEIKRLSRKISDLKFDLGEIKGTKENRKRRRLKSAQGALDRPGT